MTYISCRQNIQLFFAKCTLAKLKPLLENPSFFQVHVTTDNVTAVFSNLFIILLLSLNKHVYFLNQVS